MPEDSNAPSESEKSKTREPARPAPSSLDQAVAQLRAGGNAFALGGELAAEAWQELAGLGSPATAEVRLDYIGGSAPPGYPPTVRLQPADRGRAIELARKITTLADTERLALPFLPRALRTKAFLAALTSECRTALSLRAMRLLFGERDFFRLVGGAARGMLNQVRKEG